MRRAFLHMSAVSAVALAGGLAGCAGTYESAADTLAVIRVLELDEDGVTFAWRVLQRNPVWSRR